MATATLVPLSEYLTTSYEHDPEWIEGELRERPMPDRYHSQTQSFFISFFARRTDLGLSVCAELRLRSAPGRYRIPDICLLRDDAPFQAVPDIPPVLCIEILSPDDSMSEMHDKIADYLTMGVPNIWIVDPRRRALFTADATGTHTAAVLTLPGTDVSLTADQILAELDRLLAKQSSPNQ